MSILRSLLQFIRRVLHLARTPVTLDYRVISLRTLLDTHHEQITELCVRRDMVDREIALHGHLLYDDLLRHLRRQKEILDAAVERAVAQYREIRADIERLTADMEMNAAESAILSDPVPDCLEIIRRRNRANLYRSTASFTVAGMDRSVWDTPEVERPPHRTHHATDVSVEQARSLDAKLTEGYTVSFDGEGGVVLEAPKENPETSEPTDTDQRLWGKLAELGLGDSSEN